jgi:uncharacterized Tic20 family protein
MAQANVAPLDSIALRGGGTLEVWRDRIVANGHVFWMHELTGAVQMSDPAATPGVAPLPAVGLRGRDSAWNTYVPADPPDALRALRTIYSVRPDLTGAMANLPPGYMPLRDPTVVTREQTVLAGIAHLSVFFAPFLLPLIIWLALQPTAPYAARQAKQAFLFHVFMTVAGFGLGVLVFLVFFGSVFVGSATGRGEFAAPGLIALPLLIMVAIAVGLTAVGLSIYGAVEAFQGHPFHYPLLGRF